MGEIRNLHIISHVSNNVHAAYLKVACLAQYYFLMYINDLPDLTRHKCKLCADDIYITISYKDILCVQPFVNHIIGKQINIIPLVSDTCNFCV